MDDKCSTSIAHTGMPVIAVGTRLSRLLLIGLTAFLTVVDLFAAQALLPALTAHYGVAPSSMGLAVNACTLGMATGGLVVALLSERLDRRLGLFISLTLLAIPTTLLAHAPDLWAFAGLRILQGLCMAAAFGLMLAHLGERFSANDATAAFAAYITGNVASNLVGRLIATSVVDHAGLAANFYVFAALNLAGAVLVFFTVHRVPSGANDATDATASPMCTAWTEHLGNARLRAGFGIGFCILFAFIGIFTYVNFVLVSPPLNVGMMQLGLVYFVFLPSIFTTPIAGALAQRIGTRATLWTGLAIAAAGLPLLVSNELIAVLAGMTLVASGTFAAQATATGYVSRAAVANRAAASGIYLASYFSGGLVGSAVIGIFFDSLGWTVAVAGVGAALAAAAILTARLKS